MAKRGAGVVQRGLLWGALGLGAISAVLFGLCFGYPCLPVLVRNGLWLERCPVGDMRLSAEVGAVAWVRGQQGAVRVAPRALFLEEGQEAAQARRFRRGVSATHTLKDGRGEVVSGFTVGKTKREPSGWTTAVTVPDVPDGDYILESVIDAGFDQVTVTVPVPLYAPALVHVASDRPLYKPGQDVLLRSVTWRRTDLAPLDGRTGTWKIIDPRGEVVHEERDAAGPWGVAGTSFPLDRRAEVGTWSAVWESGDAQDTIQFDVRPFKLPLCTVDVTPGAAWFGVSDRVWLEGTVQYASGAPAADAVVNMTLRQTDGRWPMPLEWGEPREVRTDSRGRFSVDVGTVPADLLETAVISASGSVVVDGDAVAWGGVAMTLSEDRIAAEAVTAFGGGLAQGFNNRVYVRVTTPDGRPLRQADVAVRPAWDPTAKVQDARTDADGVAALQVDPGAPVTVVIPAAPVRVRPLTPDEPRVTEARELMGSRPLDLAERRVLDGLQPAIASCGTLAPGGRDVVVGVEVGFGGEVVDVAAAEDQVDRCVVDAVRNARFVTGEARIYRLRWRVPDSLQPSLRVSLDAAAGSADALGTALGEAAVAARACLPRGVGQSGAVVLEGHWRTRVERTESGLVWREHSGHGLSRDQVSCVRAALTGVTIDPERAVSGLGSARVTLDVPRASGVASPKAGTLMGYELEIVASSDGEELGDTRLRLPTGTVPPLRLRASPTLAAPGQSVTVELLRGPGWVGELPRSLRLLEGTIELDEQDVSDGKVTFTIPDGVDGFVHAEYAGARAVVFVRRPDPLVVELSTERDVYAPGERATLVVTTRAGEQPVSASVGLMGVDSTLGQLAPLLQPDDPGRVLVRATSSEPAFGAFDAKALVLGTVQGENAAKAAVLRVQSLPMDPAGDTELYASTQAGPDATLELTEAFYAVYSRLRQSVRAWQAAAPEGEQMDPAGMAKLWADALGQQMRAGEPFEDAWGRPVTLDVLPDELLAQVDPRVVVTDATRLPEDVVDWIGWVRMEVH